MIKIDNSLLDEIGLGGLPEAEKSSFLKHVYETLEMRVGIRLADQMSNEQLDEFERYFEAKDDAGAFRWLETNFPNYKDIVQQEFDKLKAEVQQSAPQILAASQAHGDQNPVPAGQAPPPLPNSQSSQAPAPLPTTSPVPAGPIDPLLTPAPTMPSSPPPAFNPAPPLVPPTPPTPPAPASPPMPRPPMSPPSNPYQTPPTFQPPQPQADFPAQQPPAGPST